VEDGARPIRLDGDARRVDSRVGNRHVLHVVDHDECHDAAERAAPMILLRAKVNGVSARRKRLRTSLVPTVA